MTAASDLVAATRVRGAPVFVGSRSVVAGTVGFALHRGVVAVANRPPPAGVRRLLADAAGTSPPEGAPLLVAVLEGLNDHENIGALFRNAAAFGRSGCPLGMSSTYRSPGWSRGRPGSTRCGPPASSSPRWHRGRLLIAGSLP